MTKQMIIVVIGSLRVNNIQTPAGSERKSHVQKFFLEYHPLSAFQYFIQYPWRQINSLLIPYYFQYYLPV